MNTAQNLQATNNEYKKFSQLLISITIAAVAIVALANVVTLILFPDISLTLASSIGIASLIFSAVIGVVIILKVVKKNIVLREKAEQHYKSLVENIPDVVWTADEKGRVVFLSSDVDKMLGFTPEEYYKNNDVWFNQIHSDDVSKVKKSYEDLFVSNKEFNIEYRYKTKDGKWLWLSDRSNKIYEKDGIRYADGVFSDITEKKEAYEKINLQSQLLEAGNQAVIYTDLTGKIIYWNTFAETLYGWKKEEVVGKNIVDVTPSQTTHEQAEEIMHSLQNGQSWKGEFLVKRKDGKEFPVMVADSPFFDSMHNIIGVVGVSTDITSRKEIEDAIKDSEQKYRELFETINQGIEYFDKDCKIITVNAAARRMLGVPLNTLLGKTPFTTSIKYIKEDGSDLLPDFYPAWLALKTGKPVKNVVMGFRHPDSNNEYTWILMTATPQFKNGETEPYQIFTNFTDFTQLKEANDMLQHRTKELQENQNTTLKLLTELSTQKTKLEQEKNRITTILTSIGEGVFVTDVNGKIVLLNAVAEKLSGFTQQEVAGRNYSDFFRFLYENGEHYPQFVEEVIKTGQIRELSQNVVLVRKDGSKVPVADSAAPVKNETGEVFGCIVSFRDVTREREVDKAKSEFVSLASHELKTPLGIMKWYLEELRNDDTYGQASDRVKEYLEDVNKTNERVLDIVRSLLDVSRIDQGRVKDEPQHINVQRFITDVIAEMKVEADKKSITITASFANEFPDMFIDPKRLNEVIQNLLSNAIKYGRERGEVKVEAKIISDSLELKVIDNGIGIPKKDMPKLFTRFFRANNALSSATEGTGLGLYVVKSYVEGWGGKIVIESIEGQGTIATLYIPFKVKKI